MDRRSARRTALGIILSGLVGTLAYRRNLLTASGAAGAVLTGTSAVAGGGWGWAATLVYFFVSSSGLSRVSSGQKARVAADKFAKGSQRDLAQVIANGGVAAAAALLRVTPWGQRHPSILAGAFAGALATATADTWATEVGTLSRVPPRLVTSWRRVPPGTSGGVSALGMAASALGAVTLTAVFVAPVLIRVRPTSSAPGALRDTLALWTAASVGGVAGSLCDSLLGATVQAMYWCPQCRVETERRIHRCGTQTRHNRGIAWLGNDGVNAASTLAGGALSGFLAAQFLPARANQFCGVVDSKRMPWYYFPSSK